MNNLSEGTVVQLKSGGPYMTCMGPPEEGYVTCRWFDDKQNCKQENFPVNSVDVVDK